MPLLRKNTEYRKQAIRTHENTTTKGGWNTETCHKLIPEDTKGQMGQTNHENEMKSTGDKTTRVGTQAHKGKQ